MTNNDILRRLRYTFDYNDAQMIALFALVDYTTTRQQVNTWLKKSEEPDFEELSDERLAIFLNGLIVEKRGKREGPTPVPEKKLTNNIILRKLKIALNLKDTDMLAIFDLANIRVSKHELSALFRKPHQSQYRECENQFLRNFLSGLQRKHRS